MVNLNTMVVFRLFELERGRPGVMSFPDLTSGFLCEWNVALHTEEGQAVLNGKKYKISKKRLKITE